MADSARHDLFYVQETGYGDLLVDPEFLDIRHTGCTLATTKTPLVSEELHADRQIRDVRHGVEAVGGGFPFELSYTTYDDLLEAVLQGTWSGNTLKAGAQRRSFHLLRHFTDLQTADKPYQLYLGSEFNTLNLTTSAAGLTTGTFDCIGRKPEILEDLTSLGTPTFEDPTQTKPFTAFTGELLVDSVANFTVTEVTLALNNQLDPRYVVGSKYTLLPTVGRCNVTGTLTAYYENSAALEDFLNEVEKSFSLSLKDPDGNELVFDLPRIKYNGGQTDTGGENAVTINLPFQALWDEATDTNISITRIPAEAPGP